ncbi:MAG: diguanylate cyclase [Chloroflexi bacterium]|nr:diguanylate cyclase [Chloroflexota bacterium]
MKVLIADDSAIPRLILQKTLTSLGHETAAASDGAEAWALYQTFLPDVVLSDWLMPGTNGIELCRQIRGFGSERYTYFVLLTAMTELEHAVTAMTAGADDFMVKPLDKSRLEATLISADRVTGLHHELRDQRAALVRANSLLFDDARRDALTHLGNRLRLTEDLATLQARIDGGGAPACVALIDVDLFKTYNDTYGHPAGDEALRSVARGLTGAIGPADMAYRYGGEEFLVLMPATGLPTATRTLDRIRAAIEAMQIPHPANPAAGVLTISGGIAASSSSPEDLLAWIQFADQALYRAKSEGRNRVMVHHTTNVAA